MILFEIFLDLALASWKFRKAVKVTFKLSFPLVEFGGQKGYEDDSSEGSTAQLDRQAVQYMSYALGPLFVCYTIYSMLYNKHRSWWLFVVGTLAVGVYAFGFIMMTPQLYINYKLKSVEHLPWRALTYKAMNTFVDDIAALLIDMPMMHRLSCFRDDVIFFVYIYQRWAYRVDKSRPSMWVGDDGLTPSEREAADRATLAGTGAAGAVGALADEAATGGDADVVAKSGASAAGATAGESPAGGEASSDDAGSGLRQRK